MHWKVANVANVAAITLAFAACAPKRGPAGDQESTVTSPAVAAPTALAPAVAAGMPTPVKVGDAAPAGTVVTAEGVEIQVASAWAKGPALIVFYRGHW